MPSFHTIVALLVLANLAFWAWAARRVHALPGARWWRFALAVWTVAMIAGLFWFAGLRAHGIDIGIPLPVLTAIFMWNLLLLPACCGLAATAYLLGRLLRICRGQSWRAILPTPRPATSAHAPSRRQVLAGALAAAPPLICAIGVRASLPELSDFRVRHINLPLPGLPLALHGLTIAHLTDLHAGKFARHALMQRVVQVTNDLHCDLAAFTGDLVDYSLDDLPPAIHMLRSIRTRFGLYVCEGNHDLWQNPAEFSHALRDAGIHLLQNDCRDLVIRGQPVQIVGLRWSLGGERAGDHHSEHLPIVKPLRNPDAFAICLVHHPHAFDGTAAAGFPLTLAGHTHGGQLMLHDKLGVGAAMFRYVSGLYRQGDAALVVANGVGNWFPVRINAPAEIIKLTLHRA